MKLTIVAASVVVFLMPTAFAASTTAASTTSQPIQSLDSALIAVMKAANQHESFMQRYTMLKPVVERALNLPQILKDSVGPLWPQVPSAQRARLLRVFTQYTVAAYVSGFAGYNGQSFRLLPERVTSGSPTVVATELVPSSGTPTKISYMMSNKAGHWQATDILFRGTISKVAMERSDFGNMVRPGNASVLIAQLQKKVASLSSGALKN